MKKSPRFKVGDTLEHVDKAYRSTRWGTALITEVDHSRAVYKIRSSGQPIKYKPIEVSLSVGFVERTFKQVEDDLPE